MSTELSGFTGTLLAGKLTCRLVQLEEPKVAGWENWTSCGHPPGGLYGVDHACSPEAGLSTMAGN